MARISSRPATALLGWWLCTTLLWGGPPPPATPQAEAAAEHLTGQWGGLRTSLAERGIVFNLFYTADSFGIVTGGLKRGIVYNGLLDLGTDIDLEKLLHWSGAHFHVNALDPQGGNPSADYVGDLGTVSNLEANDSYRLFELWLEQDLFADRFSIRAGQITFDSEFAVLETYGGLFVHSGFGVPTALAAGIPLPAYPTAALGLRVRVEPVKGFTLQAAVFDGNPAPGLFGDPSPESAATTEDNHFGTHWTLRAAEGAVFAGELGWRVHQVEGDEETAPTRTSDESPMHPEAAHRSQRGLAGAYKVGFVYHTDDFADVFDRALQERGSALARPTARARGHNYGVYVNVEQELWREPGSETQGLGAFGHVAWVPPDRNEVELSVEGGLSYRGLWRGRDDDALGLAVSYLHLSPELRRAVRESNHLEGGEERAPDFETTLELDYRYQVTPSLAVQPHVQYVIHPGGSDEHENALVVGLRTSITF